MKDQNCIFCKIANGDIPSATLYEDNDFRVILDLGPAAKGHALILPKEHFANLYELPDEDVYKRQVSCIIFRRQLWHGKSLEREDGGKAEIFSEPECRCERQRIKD